MRDKLISGLKQYPLVYKFTRFLYWKILSLKSNILGTKVEERRWSRRKVEEIKKGFSNLNHPHRNFLIGEINALYPFSDVLEVGCGYGPNLYLLSKKFPQLKFTGIDINPSSIQEGKKWLLQKGISNIHLFTCKVDRLKQFEDKTFDIVFTDALLIYIGADKINRVLKEMFRISRKALIFLEQDYRHNPEDLSGSGIYRFGHWERHYLDLLKHFTSEKQIQISKIPYNVWPGGDWSKRGYLIRVIL